MYKIGIIGTGTMGKGLCQLFSQKGYDVILKSREKKTLALAKAKIEENISKTSGENEKNIIMSRIETTDDLSKLSNADLIIETVTEDIVVKKNVLKSLDAVCSKNSILATNTSSISINELSKSVSEPSRFIGIHFFNPVQKMSLVEIIIGDNTSEHTVMFAKEIVKNIDKTPIIIKDSPGFVVNRILMITLNEAIFMLSEDVASAEDIDNAIKLGLNHPLGPLALADLIGLDICLAILETLFRKFKNQKYKPCNLLEDMVKRGHLGRKSGKGFYEYE